MQSRLIVAGVVALVFAVPGVSLAATPSHPRGVNAREHRQVERIRKGVKSDEISNGERARLRADEARLRAEERRYRESGQGLNKREFKDLQRDLDRVSRQIHRATHN